MKKNSKKPTHDYETLIQIKLAAQALKEGFWMGDLVDFLRGHSVNILGNSTNTSKWQLARSSLEAVKSKTQLSRIFKAILSNKYWYYSEPKEILKKLAQATKLKTEEMPRGKEVSLSPSTIHPIVQKTSKKLFLDGHYSQAIFEAYKSVVNQVKSVSGVTHLDGKRLMENVFSLGTPKIRLNKLQTQSDKDEQLGFMLLYGGAALGIRNPKAHDNIVQKDPIKALEYLSFASLLLKRLDERGGGGENERSKS